MDQDALDDEVEPRAFPQLTRHTQRTALPVPIQNPPLLPLSSLDPEVLERLAAEIVSRRDNLGAQFYGRRGQKQYGLDIVERERTLRRSLYQVKRYSTLSAAQLRDAVVVDYAGPPRPPGYQGPPRRFAPYRFVIMTSAQLDADTATVDELATLQDEYVGDLEIEVWGAEELSRKLRDMPNLVLAVFGAPWAKAFCGVEPDPSPGAAPKALGLVEDPVRVLNLDALKADAEAAEGSGDPLRAAHLYGLIAEGLRDGSFPGHAVTVFWRQAKALQGAGEHDAAFEILFRLALEQVLAGWSSEVKPLLSELEKLAGLIGGVRQAQHRVLDCIAAWYRSGSRLAVAVPAIRDIAAAKAPDAGLLVCLVLEQALVDGMYDWFPAQPLLVDADPDTEAQLGELRDLAANAHIPDVVLRARLRCAVADASLTLDAAPEVVDAAYRPVLDDALAGRLWHGRGLVAARAARAFAMAGESQRADNLQRQSILGSSEDGYYGDTRGAIRASQYMTSDSGVIRFFGPNGDLSYLPNRRRLLASAFDPALNALDEVHDGELPRAFGDARRYLWESRLSGHLSEEADALTLFGDVLAAAGYPVDAVAFYIHAGADAKAVELAFTLDAPVDVSRWTSSRMRRRRAAAVQVVGAQAEVVPDIDIPGTVEMLLDIATGMWQVPWNTPRPERDALDAVARFGTRIPLACVDHILVLAEPTRQAATRQGDTVANLLVQTYWAVPSRRPDIADVITDLLQLADLPPNLWSLVEHLPKTAREPLLPTVAALAEQGHQDAVQCLAAWRLATPAVQRRARQACAALLRRPVGIDRTSRELGTLESAPVQLLLALADADQLVDVPVGELGPDQAFPAGGVVATMIFTPGSAGTANLPPSPSKVASPPSGPADDSPDSAAVAAAGPVEDLLVTTAGHLTAMVADVKDAAASRVQTLHALRLLVPRLPGKVAGELAHTLRKVQLDFAFSESDLMEIASTDALSSMRFNTGARDLPALLLLIAAEMFNGHCKSSVDSVGDDEREFARAIVASALPLLRDQAQQTRIIATLTIVAVASAAPEFCDYANGLLYHPDAHVRAAGAMNAPLNLHLVAALAADPAARVRAALAGRGAELPEDVRDALAQDPHLAVRHHLVQPPAHAVPEPAVADDPA